MPFEPDDGEPRKRRSPAPGPAGAVVQGLRSRASRKTFAHFETYRF